MSDTSFFDNDEVQDKDDDLRDSELSDLTNMMAREDSRRVLVRVLQVSGVIESSYDEDPSKMVLSEGRRDIGLWLLQELKEADAESAARLIGEVMNNV